MYHLDDEMRSVLAFQALMGQRRHGHFDHDAHGMTGPAAGTAPLRKSSTKPSVAQEPGAVATVILKFKRDESTGELLRD